MCWLLSRGSFLSEEPDFHLLAQPLRAAQKIEFVFPASLETYQREHPELGPFAQSRSRQDLAGYASKKSSLYFSPPRYAAVRFSPSTIRNSFWLRSTATKYATSLRATARVARLALPFRFSES